jgi:hypothetical protein
MLLGPLLEHKAGDRQQLFSIKVSSTAERRKRIKKERKKEREKYI